MSNIFNLLGGLAESNGGQIKPITRSNTSHEIRVNSLKTMASTKPKGLSIRSHSDMNISSISNIQSSKKSIQGREQDCSKLKVTQIDSKGRPISPGKEISAKTLIAQSSKFKESVLKEDSMLNKCTKKQLNDGTFKKPLLPKKNIKKFPKPEKLAYWHDNQYDFDYGYIETIEKEFKELLSKEKENIKPCEENILASDSKTSLLPDGPKLILDETFDEEYKKLSSLAVLEVSDLSDDENL
ncbi:uncharacterized protein LOC105840579 isoform X1 [Monomorium pharaonis]|uniref:uncharacterized protein LOC105840579 isoform X1 n=1 Tax=Monomorium pharaonis TaxID=307658 RepID=UPI00063EE2A6|nr:uncharacterized protein LOC105840579 isoform X1 [Monomorium pharaonis]